MAEVERKTEEVGSVREAESRLEGILGSMEPEEPVTSAEEEGEEEDEEVEEQEQEEEESDATEDEDADEGEQPQTFSVKVDGEQVEVTLDEALAGYMRQAAFTKKTTAVAEERKKAQAEQEQLRSERQEVLQRYNDALQVLGAVAPPQPDWVKVQSGDNKEVAKVARWQEFQQKVAAVQEKAKTELGKLQEDNQKAYQARIEQEKEALALAIPEWTDETKAEQEKVALVQYAQDRFSLTQEELSSIVDHRIMVALRESMLYRQLIEKRPGSKELKSTKSLKPGSPKKVVSKKQHQTSTALREARERLSETRSASDAAALIEHMLSQE